MASRPPFKNVTTWPAFLSVLLILAAAEAIHAGDRGSEGAFKITKDEGSYLITRAGKPVLRYRFGNVKFKPYVSELFLPDGTNILRDAPHDHLHHHALMFAWNVDKTEFWGEAGKVGRQRSRKEAGPTVAQKRDGACVAHPLDWVSPEGKPLLREDRKVCALADSGPADVLLLWQGIFQGPRPDADIEISGREYLGLGIRFKQTMDHRKSRFLAANGKTAVKKVNGSRCDWCAVLGEIAPGKPITLVFMDHPQNPRHPARWFAMDQPFAYLSATIGLKDHPYTLKAGQTLTLRYGVALWSGSVGKSEIDRAYRHWLNKIDNP